MKHDIAQLAPICAARTPHAECCASSATSSTLSCDVDNTAASQPVHSFSAFPVLPLSPSNGDGSPTDGGGCVTSYYCPASVLGTFCPCSNPTSLPCFSGDGADGADYCCTRPLTVHPPQNHASTSTLNLLSCNGSERSTCSNESFSPSVATEITMVTSESGRQSRASCRSNESNSRCKTRYGNAALTTYSPKNSGGPSSFSSSSSSSTYESCKSPIFPSTRFFIAVLLCFCFISLSITTSNLSVSMVCMVGKPASVVATIHRDHSTNGSSSGGRNDALGYLRNGDSLSKPIERMNTDGRLHESESDLQISNELARMKELLNVEQLIHPTSADVRSRLLDKESYGTGRLTSPDVDDRRRRDAVEDVNFFAEEIRRLRRNADGPVRGRVVSLHDNLSTTGNASGEYTRTAATMAAYSNSTAFLEQLMEVLDRIGADGNATLSYRALQQRDYVPPSSETHNDDGGGSDKKVSHSSGRTSAITRCQLARFRKHINSYVWSAANEDSAEKMPGLLGGPYDDGDAYLYRGRKIRSSDGVVPSATKRHNNDNNGDQITVLIESCYDQGKLDWNPFDVGVVFAAQNVGSLMMLFTGTQADRLNGKWTIVVAMTLLVVSNVLMPLLSGTDVWLAFGARVLTGLSDALLQPSASAMIIRWFPPKERPFAIGLITGGRQIGTLIILPVAGFLCSRHDLLNGWPAIFYLSALIGSVILFAWLLMSADKPSKHFCTSNAELKFIEQKVAQENLGKRNKRKAVPWRQLLRCRALYIGVAALICHEYPLVIMLQLLPKYIHDVLKLSSTANGFISALPIALLFVSKTFSASLSSVIGARKRGRFVIGRTPLVKIFNGVASLGLGVCTGLVPLIENQVLAIVVLCMANAFAGLHTPGVQTALLQLAPAYTGVITGIAFGCVGIAGIFNKVFSSYVVKQGTLAEWSFVFWNAAVVALIPVMFFTLWGSADRQPWAHGNGATAGGSRRSRCNMSTRQSSRRPSHGRQSQANLANRRSTFSVGSVHGGSCESSSTFEDITPGTLPTLSAMVDSQAASLADGSALTRRILTNDVVTERRLEKVDENEEDDASVDVKRPIADERNMTTSRRAEELPSDQIQRDDVDVEGRLDEEEEDEEYDDDESEEDRQNTYDELISDPTTLTSALQFHMFLGDAMKENNDDEPDACYSEEKNDEKSGRPDAGAVDGNSGGQSQSVSWNGAVIVDSTAASSFQESAKSEVGVQKY